MRRSIVLVGILIIFATGCSVILSDPEIVSARLALNDTAPDSVTSFSPEDAVYCIVELDKAPNSTEIRFVWRYLADDGAVTLHETTFSAGSGRLAARIEPRERWETGSYVLDIYLNDDKARSLKFSVENEPFRFGG